MASQSTVDSLTARLRRAHIASLRQRYEALISTAKTKKRRSESEYFDGAQSAYIDTSIKLRDLPQQMAALGLSGAVSETMASALMAQYSKQLAELSQDREMNAEDYDFEISRQRAAMNNAVNEYNLRNALADEKASLAKESEDDDDDDEGGGGGGCIPVHNIIHRMRGDPELFQVYGAYPFKTEENK